MSWLEPIAMNIEKAVVGPITRRDEKDEEEHGAIDARAIKKIGKKEESHDESMKLSVTEGYV